MKDHFKPFLGSEDDFQIMAAKFLDMICPGKWYHVANERKTAKQLNRKGVSYSATGAKLKAKGVKKGVPDIHIKVNNGTYFEFVIELKVGNNKPTKEQYEWLYHMERQGAKVLITYSLEELIYEVKKYLNKL